VKIEANEVVYVKHGKKRVRKHRTVVIGTVRYSSAAGSARTLSVKLDAAGRHQLAIAKKHRLRVEIVATVSGGNRATRRETIFTVVKKKR
jgi:hypothetical protein